MNSVSLRFQRGRLLDARGEPIAWPELAVVGDPIEHSLSPRLHNAALRSRGVAEGYAAVQVTSGEFEACLESAWRDGCRGLNVTVPHKENVLGLVESVGEGARRIGAANTLERGGAGFKAHNTDAPGLAWVLERLLPGAPWRSGRSAIVGAGGAARAAVDALAAIGADRVEVLARAPGRAAWAVELGWPVRPLIEADLTGLALLIQATPLGLSPDDESPIPAADLDPGTAVMDLCYGPAPSRLLREAASRGCWTRDGLPMLVAQAALSHAIWFPGTDAAEAMAESVGLSL